MSKTKPPRPVKGPITTTGRPLIDYPFPLDDGALCHLRLPQDLTEREAERIAHTVKTFYVVGGGTDNE